MNNTKACKQYLQHYAEHDIQHLSGLSSLAVKRYVVVIPAFDETVAFVERLQAHTQATHVLLVLVLNEPDTQCHSEGNRRFREQLLDNAQSIETSAHLSLIHTSSLTILLVDKCNAEALPHKQGVGLARKIGTDIACALIASGQVSTPWIFSSDADAHLPQHYFDLPAHGESVSAYVFNFTHHYGDQDVSRATRIYENCIKYYQQQLEQAGSPYAFYTLGSCLAVSMSHYCQVRGFPKRAAAEDFYLLNKLAKVGRVETNNAICIDIEARLSERVPFGTGPAVAQIMGKCARSEAIYYYNPAIFIELNAVLNAIPLVWENMNAGRYALEGVSDISIHALTEAGFESFAQQRYRQDKNLPQFEGSFHRWFDAFQTLKFVKRLQSKSYPDVEISALFRA